VDFSDRSSTLAAAFRSDFANQSGNARERQPQKAVAANLRGGCIQRRHHGGECSGGFSLPTPRLGFYNGMREFGFYRSSSAQARPD
jgi:hypothetical protein